MHRHWSRLVSVATSCLLASACSESSSAPRESAACAELEACCESLAAEQAEVCAMQLSAARSRGDSGGACTGLLDGYVQTSLCSAASQPGTDAGESRDGGESSADLDGGADGGQPAICARYVRCATQAMPASAAPVLAAYGPQGSCWESTAQVAEDCIAGCLAGIEQLHPLSPAACALCESDAECGGATPACDRSLGECVACSTDEHCPPSQPSCDTTSQRCVECGNDAHCSGSMPACDLATRECVQCTDNKHCPDAMPACDDEQQKCTTCLVDADCRAPLLGCLEGVSENFCVPCTADAHCSSAEPRCLLPSGFANDKEYTCVECLSDEDCTERGRPYCRPSFFLLPHASDYTCVECTQDEDCATGETCDGSLDRCVPATMTPPDRP
jgi:Cys-rich repeat protein